MTMRDMHGLECPQCKIRDKFYEEFNSDSKKNVSYFGVISYVNYYVMPVSSDKSKEDFPKNDQSYMNSNICFLQLSNEWTIRGLIAKRLKQKKGLISNNLKDENDQLSRRLEEKNIKSGSRRPSFYLPEHTGNLITIKKSESFSESSPDDSVCTDKLETTKVAYKCTFTKKSPTKEKIGPKEPKLGTLKRKRWNWEKLKPKESYEDDLFEEKKFKHIPIEDSNNSEEDKITTPIWSVPISPRDMSPSPSYEDCYSPTELQNSRKEAEEYQYRRNKRKKHLDISKDEDKMAIMKKDPVTFETLMGSCVALEKFQKLEEKAEVDPDEDKDHYFSNGEDSDN